jgi:hypothetical protein
VVTETDEMVLTVVVVADVATNGQCYQRIFYTYSAITVEAKELAKNRESFAFMNNYCLQVLRLNCTAPVTRPDAWSDASC